MRSATEVFHSHLINRLKGDTENDITTNYATDVLLLTGTGAYQGHDGVRQSATELSNNLGKGGDFRYNHTLVDGDYAFLEWTARSPGGDVCDGADSFVIQDGLIVFQSIHYSLQKSS